MRSTGGSYGVGRVRFVSSTTRRSWEFTIITDSLLLDTSRKDTPSFSANRDKYTRPLGPVI